MTTSAAGWRDRSALLSLPRRAAAYVLVVDLLAVVALVLTRPTAWPAVGDLRLVAALVLCGLVSVEGSRHLGSPQARRDRPYKDMLSAWMLPCALLLPPFFALVVPVPIYLMVQLRVTRLPAVKRVFNAASVGLAGCGAALLHHALLGGPVPHDPQALLGTPRGIAAALVTAVVYSGISAVLVGGVLRLVNPVMPRWTALGRWPLQPTEAAEVCLGVLVALAAVLQPVLVALALPAMLLLQRTLLHAEMLEAARTDAKTGLANPQHWREVAEREVARAKRGPAALAVLLVDLDRFKAVNDRHGHLAGDQVLAAVAQELRAAVRPRDLVGRFGGEEFVVLLPSTSAEDAAATAERVRARVARLEHPVGRPQGALRTTVSVGVAVLGAPAQDLTGLLAAADTAMYAAKAAGRNRVRVAGRALVPRGPVRA
jgi:diguanylate cyclase (GGDEF)-like protein